MKIGGGGVIKGGLVCNTFGDTFSQTVFATVGILVEVVAKNAEESTKVVLTSAPTNIILQIQML